MLKPQKHLRLVIHNLLIFRTVRF